MTLWKPPVQMLNTKETTDTTCCTRIRSPEIEAPGTGTGRGERAGCATSGCTRGPRGQRHL